MGKASFMEGEEEAGVPGASPTVPSALPSAGALAEGTRSTQSGVPVRVSGKRALGAGVVFDSPFPCAFNGVINLTCWGASTA